MTRRVSLSAAVASVAAAARRSARCSRSAPARRRDFFHRGGERFRPVRERVELARNSRDETVGRPRRVLNRRRPPSASATAFSIWPNEREPSSVAPRTRRPSRPCARSSCAIGRCRATRGYDELRLLRGVRRHRGEATHFLGDDREAVAVFARARRFHRRVEREQLRLAGELLHERDERRDFFRCLRELIDRRGAGFDVASRARAVICELSSRRARFSSASARSCALRATPSRAPVSRSAATRDELLRRPGERLNRRRPSSSPAAEVATRCARSVPPMPPSPRSWR